MVTHPTAVGGSGVAGKCDVGQHWAARADVEHPAAVGGGEVAGEDDIRQRWAGKVAVEHPAAIGSGVAGESDVRQRRAASVVVHSAANTGGGVAGESDFRQRRAAFAAVHPAADGGEIAGEGDVGQRRVFVVTGVVHSAADGGKVAREGYVHQRRAAAVVIHPTAVAIAKSAIGLSSGNDEAIQHGGAVRGAPGDHVYGVISLDVDRVGHHAAGIGEVVIVDIAAQHGEVGLPVALAQAGFRPIEAAIKGDTVLQGECGRAVGWVGGRLMHALLDPDFIAADGIAQRGLQDTGVGPSGAIFAALRGRHGIKDVRIGADNVTSGQGNRNHKGKSYPSHEIMGIPLHCCSPVG